MKSSSCRKPAAKGLFEQMGKLVGAFKIVALCTPKLIIYRPYRTSMNETITLQTSCPSGT